MKELDYNSKSRKKMWLLSSRRGGGKALVAGPQKNFFLRISIAITNT